MARRCAFPHLKMAFLEAGVGWVPYLMERLDEKYEKLPQQAPLLSKEPSYYVKNHPIYFSCELEEKILPYVLGLGLEKKIMYPSDYPHERPTLEEFLADIPRFRARKDLSDEIKKLILRDNCIDFYSLKAFEVTRTEPSAFIAQSDLRVGKLVFYFCTM